MTTNGDEEEEDRLVTQDDDESSAMTTLTVGTEMIDSTGNTESTDTTETTAAAVPQEEKRLAPSTTQHLGIDESSVIDMHASAFATPILIKEQEVEPVKDATSCSGTQEDEGTEPSSSE
jgi:hypothetical protein